MILFAPLIARYGMHLAVIAGCLVAFAAWDKHRVNVGVQKERVRVEVVGERTDERAQVAVKAARKKAEDKPDAALRKFCRDCASP